MTNIS